MWDTLYPFEIFLFFFADSSMAKKQDIMWSIGEDEDEGNQMSDSASGSSVSDSIPIPGSVSRDSLSQMVTDADKTAIQTIAASAAELSMSPRTFLR